MRRSLSVCAALACALTGLSTASLAADEHAADEPILLTNEDVERIIGPVSKTAESPGRRVARETTTTSAGEVERIAASWQEEYYRLKAQALQRAMARGEDIESLEPGATPSQSPPAKPAAARIYSQPTCLYGNHGNLIFAPRDVDCLENRKLGSSQRSETAGSREHASCLYGLQGEVLHTPPGRTCPRRRR